MRFTLLTYNIHKCIGGADRRHDRGRITEVITHYDPDLVLLQEVDQYTKRSKTKRQADVLGKALGYRYRTYFPNVRIRGGGAYGNAILSRFPITEASNIDLTIPPKKRRSVLHARIRVRLNGKFGNSTRTLHVYNLHLGLSGVERKIQLRKFLDSDPFVRLSHQTPIIVGGDFNDVWATLGKKLLVPAGFHGLMRPIRTFPAYAPLRALDSLYVRGDVAITHVHRARLEVAKWASDHLPLVAEMEIR